MKTKITLEPETAAPLSREDQIKILQDKLKNAEGRNVASIQRRIDLLTGVDKPYCKTPEEQRQRDRALKPPPEPPKTPLWIVRGNMVADIANRLVGLDASDQTLTPEEIEAGQVLNFTPEDLLEFAKNLIWDYQHPDEIRLLQELECDGSDTTEVKRDWIDYLKVNPKVVLNAGRALTPDEIRDVTEFRAKAAAARDEARRAIFEKYPERFKHGYRSWKHTDPGAEYAPIIR